MSYKIIGKYIKELNFGIPNTKTFLLSKDISKYKINIDIKSNQIRQNLIEVLTSLNLKPVDDNFEKINEIVYSAVIELSNNNIEKKSRKIVLVEVPSNIYSELREFL